MPEHKQKRGVWLHVSSTTPQMLVGATGSSRHHFEQRWLEGSLGEALLRTTGGWSQETPCGSAYELMTRVVLGIKCYPVIDASTFKK